MWLELYVSSDRTEMVRRDTIVRLSYYGGVVQAWTTQEKAFTFPKSVKTSEDAFAYMYTGEDLPLRRLV